MERSKKPAAIPVSPIVPSAQVSISSDNSRVSAILPSGESIEVLLYGATIISWKSAHAKENLFLSSKAHLDGSKAVRGGIPLVFPLFGAPKEGHATGKLPQHGFARSSRWEYLGKSSSESSSLPGNSGDSSVKLDFGLSDGILPENVRSQWPFQFSLTYSVTLSTDGLETSLAVRNTGEKNYDFQVLFHSYLRINNISQIKITGLESARFKDKVIGSDDNEPISKPLTVSSETDRVYLAVPDQTVTVFEKEDSRFEIIRDMLPDVVVWNPWEAGPKNMGDLGPDDAHQNMICVEAGSVGSWMTLEAGDTWEGGQRIKAL